MNCYKIKIFLSVLVLGCFFSACEKDIELDLTEQKKLVILSNFSPDSLFKVRLATSQNTDNNTLTTYPKNAKIQLFEDDVFIQNFIFHRDFNSVIPYYFIDHKAVPGKNYKIIADYQDFPQAMASDNSIQRLPTSLELLTSTSEEIFQGYFEYSISAKIKLPPPISENDYFHLKASKDLIYYLGTDTFPDFQFNYSLPSEIDHLRILHEEGILLERKSFTSPQELEVNFQFYFDSAQELKGDIYLELRHVSEAYYLFHKSVGQQEITSGSNNFLSIPSTIIYNNIKNGIGNFSSYNASIDTLSW